MEFNLRQFLVENKLTKRGILNEDDNTGGILKTDAEQEEMSDEEDSWYKDDSDDSEEFEKEPTASDIKKSQPASTNSNDIFAKQAELKDLENQKDALLMQLKSDIISLNQYKAAIGTIPTKIKQLRASIEKAKSVSLDDEEPEL